jgi:CRISPR-associated protein Csm5
MTVYHLKFTTLSPVHIGDGGELRYMFDFVLKGGRTYRLNEDAVLRAKEDRLKPQRDGSYPLPGALLDPSDWENPALFRYIIPGMPRSHKEDARLKTCLKDVFDCAYLPGSSIKGALRTALAWTGWDEVGPRLDRAAIGNNRSWAGQPLEHKLFGPDPNHDLLRALRVGDCLGAYRPGEKMLVVNAQVLTERNQGSPVELEAISSEAVFNGSLEIDELLFTPEFENILHFKDRKHWLDELVPRVQNHSQARIQELKTWFGAVQGCEGIANFYHQLSGVSLGKGQALMQIGWGTGWDGKTFWTHIQKDKMLFSRLVSEFRMQKKGRGEMDRPVDRFPASRRAAMKVKENIARPAAPFGWVLVELEKLR